MSDRRDFTPWEHEEDEFDLWADEDLHDEEPRVRDDLDDMDDADLERWLGDRP